LTNLLHASAILAALLLSRVASAQIPAGDDIGYGTANASGRCVGMGLERHATSATLNNNGTRFGNGIAIMALNLSANACASLNTPIGTVKIKTQAYGSGCAALYYLIWKHDSIDPTFVWSGSSDAHGFMCTADSLATTSPIDATTTANTGNGIGTTGISLTTTAYLDHVYSIVCDDYTGSPAQTWGGPADSDVVFSDNQTWDGRPAALPCYIAERRLKLPAATGIEATTLSSSANWVEFITDFRTLQPPVPRAEGDVAGISLTKYAPTIYTDLTAVFTINGQTGFCSDCDPPSIPPKACTSEGAKTGAFVHRLSGTNYCTY
jgi:hypothetical protein